MNDDPGAAIQSIDDQSTLEESLRGHSILKLIRGLTFFCQFDMDEQEWFAFQERMAERFLPGENLLVEGEHSRHFFILLSGSVEILVGDSDDVISTLSPGAVIGEMSFLSPRPRATTVRAVEEVTALKIRHESFQTFTPAIRDKVNAQMVNILINRLVRTNKKLSHLTQLVEGLAATPIIDGDATTDSAQESATLSEVEQRIRTIKQTLDEYYQVSDPDTDF